MDNPVRDGVQTPRKDATSVAPYQAVEGAAQPITWTAGQLTIEVSRKLPDLDAKTHPQQSLSAIAGMCDLFRKTVAGPVLLTQIASFPDGLVLGKGKTLSTTERAKLPLVKKISVGLWSEFELTTESGDEGDFGPLRRSESYQLNVRIQGDAPANSADRFNFFPPVLGLDQSRYILFGYRKAASRMAVLLFHELLHVWFTYRYWYLVSNLGNDVHTGHGGYDPSKPGWIPGFFDVVTVDGAYSLPFLDALKPFYGQIDRLEGVTTPTQPTPVKPW